MISLQHEAEHAGVQAAEHIPGQDGGKSGCIAIGCGCGLNIGIEAGGIGAGIICWDSIQHELRHVGAQLIGHAPPQCVNCVG